MISLCFRTDAFNLMQSLAVKKKYVAGVNWEACLPIGAKDYMASNGNLKYIVLACATCTNNHCCTKHKAITN